MAELWLRIYATISALSLFQSSRRKPTRHVLYVLSLDISAGRHNVQDRSKLIKILNKKDIISLTSFHRSSPRQNARSSRYRDSDPLM